MIKQTIKFWHFAHLIETLTYLSVSLLCCIYERLRPYIFLYIVLSFWSISSAFLVNFKGLVRMLHNETSHDLVFGYFSN